MMTEEQFRAFEGYGFIGLCGMKAARNQCGEAFTWTRIRKDHLNVYNRVHGGMLFTIADSTAGLLVHDLDIKAVTLNSDFHYLANFGEGILVCETQLLKRGRAAIVVETKLYRIEDPYQKEDPAGYLELAKTEGTLLAAGTFTYHILQK